jgi:autophagy-related protein 17
MAHRLESLAAHYDQMAVALRESEAGEAFSQEDLQGATYQFLDATLTSCNILDMNRDTNELPSIMAELEEGAKYIETS